MNGTQLQDLRNFVVSNLPCGFATSVLMSILDSDLPRLEAINKIVLKMGAEAVESSMIELNQAMRDLGLRRSGSLRASDGDDRMWFSFAALPHGSMRRDWGTMHIHAINSDGVLYVLSPAPRKSVTNGDTEAVALASHGSAARKPFTPPATEALAQIRSVLVAAIVECEEGVRD